MVSSGAGGTIDEWKEAPQRNAMPSGENTFYTNSWFILPSELLYLPSKTTTNHQTYFENSFPSCSHGRTLL